MRKVLYIFGQLDDGDIEWMIGSGERRFVAAGTELIRQGEPVAALFIVLEGFLAVTLPNLGGRQIARLGVGEAVGEMSFIDSRPPSATVIALEQSVVFALAVDVLNERLANEDGFAARFYRALAIYLSNNLRERHRLLAYSDDVTDLETAAADDDADELDSLVLDRVSLAGERFERLLKRVSGG